MISSAPGKLILTGEYAVLDGAPALVIAVNRRVTARRRRGPRGSSPYLVAVAEELAHQLGAAHPAARAALEIIADSGRLFLGGQKLGLGSSAAVTVAATALALAADHEVVPVVDREQVAQLAFAAHGRAQVARGARGSGADIAAAVHGGVIAYRAERLERLAWPAGLTLIPFFTGASADTPALVARVAAARTAAPAAVEAALTTIAETSRATCQACGGRAPELAATGVLSGLVLAGRAIDQLATATGIALVPPCVVRARGVLATFGGVAKTTGAGGGDVAIGVIPATEDVAAAVRLLREVGCEPIDLSVDPLGVDLSPDVQ